MNLLKTRAQYEPLVKDMMEKKYENNSLTATNPIPNNSGQCLGQKLTECVCFGLCNMCAFRRQ